MNSRSSAALSNEKCEAKDFVVLAYEAKIPPNPIRAARESNNDRVRPRLWKSSNDQNTIQNEMDCQRTIWPEQKHTQENSHNTQAQTNSYDEHVDMKPSVMEYSYIEQCNDIKAELPSESSMKSPISAMESSSRTNQSTSTTIQNPPASKSQLQLVSNLAKAQRLEQFAQRKRQEYTERRQASIIARRDNQLQRQQEYARTLEENQKVRKLKKDAEEVKMNQVKELILKLSSAPHFMTGSKIYEQFKANGMKICENRVWKLRRELIEEGKVNEKQCVSNHRQSFEEHISKRFGLEVFREIKNLMTGNDSEADQCKISIQEAVKVLKERGKSGQMGTKTLRRIVAEVLKLKAFDWTKNYVPIDPKYHFKKKYNDRLLRERRETRRNKEALMTGEEKELKEKEELEKKEKEERLKIKRKAAMEREIQKRQLSQEELEVEKRKLIEDTKRIIDEAKWKLKPKKKCTLEIVYAKRS